ncbi:MAG: hydantoinase/oxoprolinase family protein, partial [bacterium]
TRDSIVDGLPIRVPVLDIHTVGAGGGSIAWRDTGGALRVGPRSAGSSPGPACYPGGGSSFTVTDANLVLGRLPGTSLLAGRMPLCLPSAKTAADVAGAEHGVTGVELAAATLSIANAAMVRAIKVISVERGHDPREFSLLSFGGAGGLHACELADELGIRTVVVPRMPGLLSAFGMLSAPQLRTASMTVLRVLSADALLHVDAKLAQMETSLLGELPNAELTRSLACRYRGQSFELDIAWASDPDTIVAAFTALHVKAYGYAMDREIEVVNARAVATLRSAVSIAAERMEAGAVSVQDVVGVGPVDVVPRANLEPDGAVMGPMIITELSSTTWVPPGWSVRNQHGHLVLERQ